MRRGGKNPAFFAEEAAKRDWNHFGMVPKDIKYNQSHATIYEQEEAVGHSVRAVYMYTAMADLAATEHDEKLFAACERLWNNMTEKEDVYNRRYRLNSGGRGLYEGV